MTPSSTKIRADLILLLVATIWGFGFVAQSLGMTHLGPFGFNSGRFFLGAISLLPLLLFFPATNKDLTRLLKGGILAGFVLFAGASLQQAGLLYTSAGNAGFITGLYIIFVPLLGIISKHKTALQTWLGGLVSLIGLYLLSFKQLDTINPGDLLNLLGAICWAIHVLVIARLAPKVDNLRLAILQFFICSLLSSLVALSIEADQFNLPNMLISWQPLCYAGLISVGIAYTLQIVAQKNAPPAHAAIIMSLEAVAAIIGGWWILGEQYSPSDLIGCGLMLSGMILSQLPLRFKKRSTVVNQG